MLRCLLVPFAVLAAPAVAQPDRAALDELLAVDRLHGMSAARAPDAVAAYARMFDAEIVMPTPAGFAIGREAALAAFRDSPAFRGATLSWAPIRAGVSADGTQGFTYGYLTLSAGDPARRERKYLAYWVRRPLGWRILAYRQLVREPGSVDRAMLPPAAPAFIMLPSADEAQIAAHRDSLAAAEAAFSARAQQVGLRAAFREYGRSDAMNMGGPGPIRVGLDALLANFPEGVATSPVRWSTERSFVASSGDLGISIGTIHANGPVPEGQPSSFPFFTIWRRDTPDQPWRYIAE